MPRLRENGIIIYERGEIRFMTMGFMATPNSEIGGLPVESVG